MNPIEFIKEFWQRAQENPVQFRWTMAILFLVFALPVRWLIRAFLKFLRVKVFSKTSTHLDEKIIQVIEDKAKGIVFVIMLRLALRQLRFIIPPESVLLKDIAGWVSEGLYLITAFIILRVALGIVRAVINDYFSDVETRNDSKQLRTIEPLLRKLTLVAVVLIGAVIVMEHFTINVGSLLVSLGVGSLAIALAAQDTIANIIAGIIIAVDQPFRVGDRIELSNGKIADVVQIGLRSTRIMDFDLNYLVVPNSDLVKSSIINYAYPTHKIRVLVSFNVVYGTPIEKVREIGLGIAKAHRFVVQDPISEVQFMKFGESGVEMRVECYVADFTQKFYAEIELREQLYAALLQNGIEIAVPRRVVELRNAPKS
jgi:MscS family membrane protein